MDNPLNYQLVRFALVGGLNTLFSYAVYAVLLYLGLPFAVANFGAMALGILFSFRTQGALVFRNRDRKLLLRFACCWVLIYLFNIGLIAVLVRAGLNAYTAGALALLPVTLLSYVVQKLLVFGGGSAGPSANSAR